MGSGNASGPGSSKGTGNGNGNNNGGGSAPRRDPRPNNTNKDDTKRKNRDDDGPNSKSRKKAKRTIEVAKITNQPTKQSSTSSSSTSTPSSTMNRPTARVTSKAPRTIQPVEFAEARAFEINAMEKAIYSTTDGTGKRVFQSLPRNLRRRAASHNPKRVPLKHRGRALQELAKDSTPPKGPTKTGKMKQKRHRPAFKTDFAVRARKPGRKWLETHVFHAKRFHMTTRWGYQVAESSNDRSVRATYRGSKVGCLVHDASCFGVLELTGSQNMITQLLTIVLPECSVASVRYIYGTKVASSMLHQPGMYPYSAIGPVTFQWNPVAKNADGELDENAERKVWIWIHPSAMKESQQALFKARDIMKTETNQVPVRIIALVDQFGRFELTGPYSQRILKQVLQLVDTNTNEASHRFWKQFCGVRSASCFPPGMILALNVWDPRLNFPVKMSDSANEPLTPATPILPPTVNLAASVLWESKQSRTNIPHPPEKQLNNRRAKSLIPGTPLTPDPEQDTVVPILLIQRCSVPSSATTSSRTELNSGWDLIVPKHWCNDFFKSLVFAGAKPIGQEEHRGLISNEIGLSCFPWDYPNTLSGQTITFERSLEVLSEWESKPPAKRVSYGKLGMMRPFECPWDEIVDGYVGLVDESGEKAVSDEAKALPPRQQRLHVLESYPSIRTRAEFMETLKTHAERNRVNVALDVEQLSKDTLTKVVLDFHHRGKPTEYARIYAPNKEEVEHWNKVWKERKWRRKVEDVNGFTVFSDEEEEAEDEEGMEVDEDEEKASQRELLGFVLSGGYTYSEGRGAGIGCVSLQKLDFVVSAQVELSQGSGAKQEVKDGAIVLVRAVNSRVLRPAKIRGVN